MKSRLAILVCFVLAASGAFAQTTVVYAGLTNTGLGTATLTISNDLLVVGDLGSNGADGMSISLPTNLTALEVNTPLLDVSNDLPVGAYIEEAVIGASNLLLGTLTVTKESETNGIVTGDFLPLGSSNFTVLAYSNGVFVAGATNVPETDVLVNYDSDLALPSYDIEPGLGVTINFTPTKVVATLGDPVGPVTCDKIYFIPEGVSFNGPFTALNVTSSQVPTIVVAGEFVSPVAVNLSRTGTNLVLQWFGTSTLQISANLASWSNMPAAASPHTIPIGLTNQFFRISQTNTF